MAKITLEFDMFEDKEEYETALRGSNMQSALWDIQQQVFRPSWKHGYGDEVLDSEEADPVIEALHKKFLEILEEYQLLDVI